MTTLSANRKQFGFTLIELMIVVAIIGIITMIAFPAYQSQMRKTKRSEAKSALTSLAALEEKYYGQCNRYTTNITGAFPATGASSGTACAASTGLGSTATSSSGYYTLSAALSTTKGFVITATAAGTQTKDSGCTTLTLDGTGAKTPASGCW